MTTNKTLTLTLLEGDAQEIGYQLRNLSPRTPETVALAARFTSAMAVGSLDAQQRNAVAVVDALLAAGYALNVDNGGDELELPAFTVERATILGAMFATGDETILCRKEGAKRSFVHFVYGNAPDGSEVVADFGLSLESIIDPLVDSWQPSEV